MFVAVVEGLQYPNQMGHNGEEHKDVEALMRGAEYVEFTRPYLLGKLGLLNHSG